MKYIDRVKTAAKQLHKDGQLTLEEAYNIIEMAQAVENGSQGIDIKFVANTIANKTGVTR